MGYVYELDRRTGRRLLCCDVCNTAGDVKRRSCKYGYCPPVAACGACWAKIRGEQSAHCEEHCKPAAAEYAALEAARATVLESGAYIFRAALGVGALVRLTFRNGSGEKIEVDATRSVYEHVRALPVATLDDAREAVGCVG